MGTRIEIFYQQGEERIDQGKKILREGEISMLSGPTRDGKGILMYEVQDHVLRDETSVSQLVHVVSNPDSHDNRITSGRAKNKYLNLEASIPIARLTKDEQYYDLTLNSLGSSEGKPVTYTARIIHTAGDFTPEK